MDIVKKIKPLASYKNLSFRNKFSVIVILVSLAGIVVPQMMHVKAQVQPTNEELTFIVGDYDEFLFTQQLKAEKKLYHEQAVQKLRVQLKLNDRVRDDLLANNSPLANHVPTLLQQNNWKKIVALSNAESSLCRRYPVETNNCWGVGGTDLWTMGENLDEGIIAMNHFLNNYPKRSPVKYAQMSFEDMNGLYKQPARDHWLYNNQHVYYELAALENVLAYNQ